MVYGETLYDGGAIERVTYGEPDGPNITVPYLGEVPTFLSRRPDMMAPNAKNKPTLMHHVPMDMRGPYKLSEFPGILGEREGPAGFAMCTSEVNPLNRRVLSDLEEGQTRLCRAKAINRSGLCSTHGGMLHPLDRQRIDWDTVPREIRFKYGKLPVEELDDEELSRGQIRKADGTFTDNKSVSIEIHDAMVRRLFERADTKLRENLLTAVDTMADIAKSTAVEPADRIRAATWIYERIRGKVPTEVKVTQDKPFEVVLGAVLEGGSRAESRARRGVASEDELAALDDAIDAETVELSNNEYYAEEEQVEEPEEPLEEKVAREVREPNVGQASPPHDPDLRNEYEKEEQRKREEEMLENIKRARAKRFAARAGGHMNVEPVPYKIAWLEDVDDGPQYSAIIWEAPPEPKLSAHTHAKEQKRSRRE